MTRITESCIAYAITRKIFSPTMGVENEQMRAIWVVSRVSPTAAQRAADLAGSICHGITAMSM